MKTQCVEALCRRRGHRSEGIENDGNRLIFETKAEPSGSNAGSPEETSLFKQALVFVAGLSTVFLATGCSTFVIRSGTERPS